MFDRQQGATISRHLTRRVTRAWPIALCVLVTGCPASLPNVQPFAAGTATLYQAHGTESQAILSRYDESIRLAQELRSARPSPLDSAQSEAVDAILERLQASQGSFGEWDRAFDRTLRLAVDYSEALTELAAAGETGSEAATSLAASLQEFGGLTGLGTIVTEPISGVIERIADIATRVQARGSLREATEIAQGAVDTIAGLLKQIHSSQLQRLVTALVSDTDRLLLYEAGPAITGYYREANARRHLYYRRALLTLQLNEDGLSGFCRDPETAEIDDECINLRELGALREVEERLRDLTPEVERYESKRASLGEWRDLRRANGARIVKALDAWTDTHRNVQRALEDGPGVSAFSLRAILAEIDSFR